MRSNAVPAGLATLFAMIALAGTIAIAIGVLFAYGVAGSVVVLAVTAGLVVAFALAVRRAAGRSRRPTTHR